MNRNTMKIRHALVAAVLACTLVESAAGAAFVYDGRLDDGGRPAEGRYDIQITAFDGAQATALLDAPMIFEGVEVREGRFRLEFDLPQAAGDSAWLQMAVRDEGSGAGFAALEGRVKAIAAPSVGACWSTTGDFDVRSGNFLGTLDESTLRLVAFGAQGWELAASTTGYVNIVGGSGGRGGIFGPNPPRVLSGAEGAFIGGGGKVTGGVLGGPDEGNRVSDHNAVIGGGYGNFAGNGDGDPASRPFAAVLGGIFNTASGARSMVGGGDGNRAAGGSAAVLGGFSNVAAGDASAVPGGGSNCAGGSFSLAAGRRAKVGAPTGSTIPGCIASSLPGDADGHQGTFVWADAVDANFSSTGENQFMVRATGGFGLNTAPPTTGFLEMTVQSFDVSDFANLWLKQASANQNGILVSVGGGATTNNAGFFIDHYDGTTQSRRLELSSNGAVSIRSNTTGANTGVTMAANGGSFTSLSDRRLKTAIMAVDARQVLDRLVDLPVSTWSYIAQGTAIRHIGPMAQDFKAAFGVGESDTGITTIDADGVALAAIQGLNAKVDAERAALMAENADLRARIERLEARLGAPADSR